MINSVLKFVLPLALLLGTLGGALGCAGGLPQQQADWRSGQRTDTRSPAPSPGARGAAALKSKGGSPGAQATGAPAAAAQTSAALGREMALEASTPERAATPDAASQLNRSQTSQLPSGTNLRLSDTAVPNPLRGQRTRKAQAGSPVQQIANAADQSAVQTVGYQEEIPSVVGENTPGSDRMLRLANLEDPQPLGADPASVLIGDPEATPESADAYSTESSDLNDGMLPTEEVAEEITGELLSDQPATKGSVVPAPGLTSQAGQGGPAQGHYQQGSPVYGQLLNSPPQPASQRAVQLLDENERLREELQTQLKTIEGLQARLKQQDELWARARQEFVEVRSVVDNLTRENLLLKQQIEKTEADKAELARQYQNLMQTVEQTLDDLLLRAISDPPATSPPSTQPATQPSPSPPIINGQQASAPRSSR